MPFRIAQITEETQKQIINEYNSSEVLVSNLLSKYNISCDTLYIIVKKFGAKKGRIRYKQPSRTETNTLYITLKKQNRQPKERRIHDQAVEEFTKEYNKKENQVAINLNSPPIPDILVVDWKNKTITSVEVEFGDWSQKLVKYYNTNKPINTLILTNIVTTKTVDLTKDKPKYIVVTAEK